MQDQDWKRVFDVHYRTVHRQGGDATGEPSRVLVTASGDSIQLGQRIDKYEITGVIGRGGMGEVFSARDVELGRSVALKFLPHDRGDSAGVDLLIREARAASGLNHPNIVTVYEVIRSESSLAIAMELVEGVPLRVLCNAGVPVGQIAKWGGQIAQALAAAHDNRLIHRDIKPENIMVRPDGYVKVLDFGLARNIDADVSRTANDLPAGTLRYMSPEQVRRQGLTPASDIFSLGLVLFEMLSGRHPFEADSAFSTAHAIATAAAPPLSKLNPAVPAAMDSLVSSMLAKAPADRPSVEQVIAALGTAGQPASPAPAKRKWLVPVAAAACAAAALIAFFYFRENADPFGDLKSRPLAARTGAETLPAISPDGKWAAFTWAEGQEQTPEIFVQAVAADEARKLTSAGGSVRSLTWNADGTAVVAARGEANGRSEIVSIPVNGSPENRLGETLSGCAEPELDVSPDGRFVALPDCAPGTEFPSIYLITPGSGERRRLTSPPTSGRGDQTPKFSPDGRSIAFKRAATSAVEDIHIVPITGGEPKRISNDGRNIGGLAWLPDSKSLVVSSLREGSVFGLWHLAIGTTTPPRRLTQIGYHAMTPAIARGTGRMVWVNQLNDFNIWRVSLAGGPPERIIASTQRDQDAHYGPDGRIAFRSVRSGSSEIWISKSDGTSPIRLTEAKGALTGSPRWSPDGRFIAYDSRPNGNPDLYLLECSSSHGPCGKAKRITTRPSSDVMPSWSADGSEIYFCSDETRAREVWRMPAQGGAATQVTRRGGYASRESADGKWLYFSKPAFGIWRMPGSKSARGLTPDSEELMVKVTGDSELASWDIAGDEIVYVAQTRTAAGALISRVEAFNVDRKTTRILVTSSERISSGLTVSADRKWVAYGRLDRAESNVMVADAGR